MGDSPGIPYVFEIWPRGARSPIHDHAGACGLVKILFGTIQQGVFNKAQPTLLETTNQSVPVELISFDASKDDVLWLSPHW